jgi:hypothetical protein
VATPLQTTVFIFPATIYTHLACLHHAETLHSSPRSLSASLVPQFPDGRVSVDDGRSQLAAGASAAVPRSRCRGVRPRREGALRRGHLRLRNRCVARARSHAPSIDEQRSVADRVIVLVSAVGSLVGAVTGSMNGLATESGMLRGAGIGAISGAVFTIEVAESSRELWHSGDSSVWSLVYMVRI